MNSVLIPDNETCARAERGMSVDPVEKRRHQRPSVNESFTAYNEHGEYIGAVVNMSVSGAAVHLAIELDANLEPDSIVELQVKRIGKIRTRVVRPLDSGFAVEFLFDPAQDRQLITRLWKVLNEYE